MINNTLTHTQAEALSSTPRVTLLGPGGTGKSSLAVRLVRGVWLDSGDIDTTIEDQYDYHSPTSTSSRPARLRVIDTGGQSELRAALLPQWARDSQGFVLVCAADDPRSLDDCQHAWLQLRDVVCPTGGWSDAPPRVAVVLNKIDLRDDLEAAGRGRRPLLSLERVRAFADSIQAVVCVEASAKTGVNVDVAFEALLRDMEKEQRRRQKKKAPAPTPLSESSSATATPQSVSASPSRTSPRKKLPLVRASPSSSSSSSSSAAGSAAKRAEKCVCRLL